MCDTAFYAIISVKLLQYSLDADIEKMFCYMFSLHFICLRYANS